MLAAKAIQGSNSIEGFNVSVEDAIAAIEGDEPSEATEENWQANQGYRRAMTYVLQLAHDEHFSYTPRLISSLHFMIAEHSLNAGAGLWRPVRYGCATTPRAPSCTRVPEAGQIPDLIDELVAALSSDQEIHVLVRGQWHI